MEDAVAAGQRAFKTWSQTPIEKRKELLLKFIDLYGNYEKEFTDLLCKETGKPRAFANQEVVGVKGMIGYHADLTLPEEKYEDKEKVITTRFVPLGVVGAICPWNFPLVRVL